MTTSITSLPSASVPLTGTERVPMDQTIGSAVSASALVVGTGYRIESLGTTNWTACGLPAGVTAAVGLTFVATAAGTGTGTAIEAQTVEATAAAIAALAPATNLTYEQATRLLSSSTGADVTLPLATDALDGLQSAAQRTLVQALITAGVTAAGSTVTIPHIHGDLAGALYIHVKNTTAGTLAKGSPVYPTGTVGDTTTLEVAGADSSNANLLPAVGLLADALAPNASGHAVIAGELTGLNTAAYAIGDALYVASGGGLTATRPTTGTIQQVAIVGRVNSGTGSVTVTISTELSPNWDVAYNQRLRWDGGATGLDAATGRTSLGLGTAATSATTDFVSATATKAANLVFAGPASGAAAAPTFRALVAADLPAIEFIDLAYTATINIDFAAYNNRLIVIGTLTGNLSITFSNIVRGRQVTVILTSDGSNRTITYPGSTPFVGAKQTLLLANKIMIAGFTVYSSGGNDAAVLATSALQQ